MTSPAIKFRDGTLQVTVWRNKSTSGQTYYSANLTRSYRNGEGRELSVGRGCSPLGKDLTRRSAEPVFCSRSEGRAELHEHVGRVRVTRLSLIPLTASLYNQCAARHAALAAAVKPASPFNLFGWFR